MLQRAAYRYVVLYTAIVDVCVGRQALRFVSKLAISYTISWAPLYNVLYIVLYIVLVAGTM